MKVGIILLVVMFVVAGHWAGPARAELVTIAIEGVVDYVNDPFGLVAGEITAGTAITGTYTYDLSTPDSNPSPEGGVYQHRSPPCGIRMTAGGYEFRTDPGNVNFLIEILDNADGVDALLLVSYNNLFPLEGIIFTNISWTLGDDTENAFSSASLPTTAPNVLDWDYNFLQIGGSDSDIRVPGMKSFGMAGHITSAVLVPEPATIFLLGVGMVVLCLRRRER